jgi:hypothetical protein
MCKETPAMNQDRIIDHRLFVDGITRPVYVDEAGQQYVLEDGQCIDGLFLVPEEDGADVPLIVQNPVAGSRIDSVNR